MNDLLTTAVRMHQAGQLGPAERVYREVLAREQSNADVLHLLGVLCHQRGDHLGAVELIGRAVSLRPDAPAFHSNMAEAQRALGHWERAEECCRRALGLRPDYPEALCNLGLALQAQGRHLEAVEPFRRALELQPGAAEVHNNLGIALRDVRLQGAAVAHFRRAVELDPSFAAARTNLGLALLDSGLAGEALEHCLMAVNLQAEVAAVHHNLGNVLGALDRPAEARASFLEAIRLDPGLADSHAALGAILRRDGELAAALPWLKEAVRLSPDVASHWEALAELYGELDEFADAIPCWERALGLSSQERIGPHLALGAALQHEGRLAEAGEHYRAALRIRPDWAGAYLDMGWLHEELGELEAAEAAFRTAARLQPKAAPPYGRLAMLLRGRLPDADLAALEDRLADPVVSGRPRAQLLFGLAHVLDARGDYARAADCLRQANALTLELERGRREYAAADHERFIEGLIRTFQPERFARMAGTGLESRRPVFIVGLPRSGTTLIEQVLASHSRIHGAGELRLVRRTFESIPDVVGRPGPPLDCVPHLGPAEVRLLAERHLEALREKDGGRADRVVDKMPDNYVHLGLLAVLFPRATFIHCRRDLRDVAVSCWMTNFSGIRWANDPGQIASRFEQYRRLLEHWRVTLPVPVHDVDYEDAVADLEGVARRLLDACGLEWEPSCLDFHRTQRPVRTASVIQVRQPLHRRSVERWRHYERELAEMFAALPPGWPGRA